MTLAPDTDGSALLQVFARNVELLAFKRGLARRDLATRLGVTSHVMRRVLECRNHSLDPELVAALLIFFNCTPNDLFLRQPDVSYPN